MAEAPLTITAVTVDAFVVPLATTLTDTMHGEQKAFGLATVRITCSDGTTGLGYAPTVKAVGVGAVRALLAEDMAPLLLGEDPRCVERLWEKLWWQLHYVGRGGVAAFAMATADVALWDIKGRRAGEPWWRMLGGHSNTVRAYAGGIDLLLPLPALLQQTRDNLAKGFTAIKMKVGRPKLAEDVARVVAMRELVGPDVLLMVDANMRWTAAQAIDACKALKASGAELHWVEEPIIPDDLDGTARVASEGGVPIATGENLHTVYEFKQTIEKSGLAFVEPDLVNLGGVTPFLKVAHLAEAANLPVTSHGVHDLHLHLLAAIPNASLLESHGFNLDPYLSSPPVLPVEGLMTAPNRPGHGVELNFEKLEQFRSHPAFTASV